MPLPRGVLGSGQRLLQEEREYSPWKLRKDPKPTPQQSIGLLSLPQLPSPFPRFIPFSFPAPYIKLQL